MGRGAIKKFQMGGWENMKIWQKKSSTACIEEKKYIRKIPVKKAQMSKLIFKSFGMKIGKIVCLSSILFDIINFSAGQ